MNFQIDNDKLLDHAWKYFEIHSNQRITLFNYFLFIVAAFGTALGGIFQAPDKFLPFGIGISFFICLVSVVFWKLDQRTALLIKQAERVLQNLENESLKENKIFETEQELLEELNLSKGIFKKVLTYRLIFRGVFLSTGLTGFFCLIYFCILIF